MLKLMNNLSVQPLQGQKQMKQDQGQALADKPQEKGSVPNSQVHLKARVDWHQEKIGGNAKMSLMWKRERRRFTPSRQPGFQLPGGHHTWNPFDIFKLFFSQETTQTIVNNTEEYAAKLKAKRPYMRWNPLTVNELYSFIGIIIFMGLISVPTLTEYWKTGSYFGQDFVRNSGMTQTRFLNILAALHLCEYEKDRK